MTIFLPARATGALLRRLAGPRQLMLLTLLLAAAPAAFSATLQCGRYDSTDGHGHWQVESADRAMRQIDGLAATPLLIGQQGQTLEVADLLDGYSSQYTLSGDGRRISNRFSAFTLSTPARCQQSAPAAAGSCRADIAHCFAQAGSASPAQLQQWCREDLPFACNQLLQHYQQAARAAHPPAVDDPDLIEPAVCREHTPAYDETACNEAAGAAISKAMGRMLLGALDRSRPRLPEDQLHELMQLCRGPAHAAFCANVAEAHWDAGQYLLARQALQLACSRGGGQRTCAQAEALSALVAADLQAAPATALPCGDYRAATGLIDTLSFADQGLVAMSMGTRLRARLQDGRVHIRHDKGDDFVFQVLDRQRLIGIDSWNRYALYQREGGSERCSAAPVYVEVPLLQDCPSGAGRPGAQACCDAGAMQGCNVLGHQQALNGDWQAAAPYYLKMCRAGIRVGCENLVSAYANGGDDHIREQIAGLCAGDASGSHVACDVLATSNWDMLALGVELSRTAERIEAAGGDAVAEPGAHRNRKSLKK